MADGNAKSKTPFDANVAKWVEGLKRLKYPVPDIDKLMQNFNANVPNTFGPYNYLASILASAQATQIKSVSDLGKLVRKSRKKQKLSQQDFADLAGVGRRFLSELENGKQTLEIGKVIQIVTAAGIDLFAKER